MLDNTYIVDRVRGIQQGMSRLVQAGFKYEFYSMNYLNIVILMLSL
jgi:hypothetical protein